MSSRTRSPRFAGKACSVLYCTQRGYSENISYHKVPSLKNSAMRCLWLKRIRRRDYIYKLVKHILVCSKHFKSSDFKTLNGKFGNRRKYLKEGAVPSIFPWEFSHQTKVTNTMESTSIKILKKYETTVETTSKEYTTEQNDSAKNNRSSEESVIPITEDQECVIEPMLPDIVTVVEPLNDYASSEDQCIKDLSEKHFDQSEINIKCKCAETIKELKATIEKLKRVIEVQNFKMNKAEKDLRHGKILKKVKNIDFKPSIERIKNNNKDIAFYTGLPNYEKLMALYHWLNPGPMGENINLWNCGNVSQRTTPTGSPRKLSVEDQFLLVLMRLRLGLFLKDLADRFNISPSTASNYCITWINFMYFRLGKINIWPTREAIDATMPQDFKTEYPTTRVIIDAIEIKCQTSKSLVSQSASCSNYKSTNTYKGLIGISPNGYVTFVSHLFTGSISDQEITRRSGFMDLKFSANDSVMADKGFLIEKMLDKIGVKLNIPPFLSEKDHFTKEELEKSQKIAALRIDVERRIERIRGFHILNRPVPLTLAPVINQLWIVVTLLTNFQNPLINVTDNLSLRSLEDDEFYEEIAVPIHEELDNFEEEI